MGLKRWKKISEQVVVENAWWVYKKDLYELPSGSRGVYNYVHSNGSSMVIPVRENGTIIMVKQYRYLCELESLEFPAGGVKKGITHDQTARDELVEETGFSARQLVLVSRFNPYNGVTNEMCHVYVARELQQVGSAPDETEDFEIVMLTPAEIDEYIRNGTIWDGMSIAAWCQAKMIVGFDDSRKEGG
ncbi:MAG: NUDIX hydrolase [Ignavibacteria bacterium]|nr:NUDIX hydrolase [Ignavibacteria bacterium]